MAILKRFEELDEVLRGDALGPATGAAVEVKSASSRLWPALIVLAMFYGLCMGSFAMVTGRAGAWKQMLASAIKVPALFVLTLLVTFPSLYVFNALVVSRLTARSLARLLTAAVGVTVAMLASFGTIVAFFSFTTDSHPFMVVLNVVAFGVSGILGLSFLLRTLRRMSGVREGAGMPTESHPPDGAREASDSRATLVFRLWVILFALVGAQMSWVLRPFVGGQAEFALFRSRGSNFFEALYYLTLRLLGVG
ncbi:hypothetical protein BH09PLA1_BH09PLA1_31410 [soil metagenome]